MTGDKTACDIYEEMDAKEESHTCQCGSLHSNVDKNRQDRQSVDELKIGIIKTKDQRMRGG